jgi:hypothetical protein
LQKVAVRSIGWTRLGPLGLGGAVTATLWGLHLLWEIGFAHLSRIPLSGAVFADQLISVIIQVLTGFMVGAQLWLRRSAAADIERLRPVLDCSAAETDDFVRSALRMGRASAVVAGGIALPIGLLVVPDLESGLPYLLSERPWSHDFVWGLWLNALLFPLLGWAGTGSYDRWRLFARLEERVGRIDLLDLGALAPFARPGLRDASVWLVGSSLASFIFVNVDFHWSTGLVILATVGVGTLAFVLPTLGIHRRIRGAKRAELATVRETIRRVRPALFHEAEGGRDVARLPALLAYEARIEGVREWPFDTPTLARFGLLVLLATGSWLGGAVVERVLGVVLD